MKIPLNTFEKVEEYIDTLFIDIPDIVREYEKKAADMFIRPHHIEPSTGKLLQMLVMMSGAARVLEIGTMWGFSAWWLYSGLGQDGRLLTLEKDLQNFRVAKEFIQAAGMSEQVECRNVDALEELYIFNDEEFDFVFLDAARLRYPELFRLIHPKLAPGGVIAVDNVIYSRNPEKLTVADETDDERIQATQDFNRMVAEHPDYTSLPLPLGSGLMVAMKNR